MGAKLYFYYSAMNAGKSATLLQSNHNYHERGMHTMLFIPELIGSGHIQSRIGLSAPAFAFPPGFDFYAHVAEHQAGSEPARDSAASPGRCDCLLVDEAQFLTQAQVRQLSRVADELGVPVLCFGLRTDFRGEPFEGSRYLLAWADVLSEIKTVCSCGRKATMNQRVADDGTVLAEGEQVQVGGNERYVGKCRRHFWEGIEVALARGRGSEPPPDAGLATPEKARAKAGGEEAAPRHQAAKLARVA